MRREIAVPVISVPMCLEKGSITIKRQGSFYENTVLTRINTFGSKKCTAYLVSSGFPQVTYPVEFLSKPLRKTPAFALLNCTAIVSYREFGSIGKLGKNRNEAHDTKEMKQLKSLDFECHDRLSCLLG